MTAIMPQELHSLYHSYLSDWVCHYHVVSGVKVFWGVHDSLLTFYISATIYKSKNSECFAQHHKLCNVMGGGVCGWGGGQKTNKKKLLYIPFFLAPPLPF